MMMVMMTTLFQYVKSPWSMDLTCTEKMVSAPLQFLRSELPGRNVYTASSAYEPASDWPAVGTSSLLALGAVTGGPRTHLSLEVSPKGGDSDTQELTRQSVKNATTVRHPCIRLSRPGVQKSLTPDLSHFLFISWSHCWPFYKKRYTCISEVDTHSYQVSLGRICSSLSSVRIFFVKWNSQIKL